MEQLEHSIGKRSQSDRILEALLDGKKLTALDALEMFGCYRLAARIADIRARGYEVMTSYRVTPNGARIAVYRMPEGA